MASSPSQKRVLWQEAVTYLRRTGDLALCTVCLASLAVLELEEEQFTAAADLLEDAIALSDRIGAPLHLYWSWGALGEAHLLQGEFENASACSRKAVIGFRRLGLRHLSVSHLTAVACCVARLGKPKEAAQLFGAYDVMHSKYLQQAGTPGKSNRFEKLTLIKEKLRTVIATICAKCSAMKTSNAYARLERGIPFDLAVDLVLSVAQDTIVWSGSDYRTST